MADGRNYLVDAPAPGVRLVIVTSGTGASTGFGIAERVIGELFGLGRGDGMSFPIKAVVFDWAGTMVDFGCMAPVAGADRGIRRRGPGAPGAEARRDMGKAKLDHLRAILADPGVAARWPAPKGAAAARPTSSGSIAKLEPAMRGRGASAARG